MRRVKKEEEEVERKQLLPTVPADSLDDVIAYVVVGIKTEVLQGSTCDRERMHGRCRDRWTGEQNESFQLLAIKSQRVYGHIA